MWSAEPWLPWVVASPWCAPCLLTLGDPRPVATSTAVSACVYMALAAGVSLLATRVSHQRAKFWLEQGSRIALLALIVPVLPTSALTSVKPRLMTDAGLSRTFLRSELNGARAERFLRELEARRQSGRFSSQLGVTWREPLRSVHAPVHHRPPVATFSARVRPRPGL